MQSTDCDILSRDQGCYWDALSEEYARQRKPSPVDDRVLDLSPFGSGRRAILEVGPGPGTFAEQLFKRYHPSISRYTGLDVAGRFLHMTRLRLAEYTSVKQEYIQASIADYPDLEQAGYDICYCMACLHHLAAGDLDQAFQNISHALRAGGTVILVEDWALEPQTPEELCLYRARQAVRDYDGGAESHLNLNDYLRRLEAAQFRIVNVTTAPRPVCLDEFNVLRQHRPELYAELSTIAAPAVAMAICVAEKCA